MRLFVFTANMQRFDSRASAIRHMYDRLGNLEAGREFHEQQRAQRVASLNIINECTADCGENIGGSTAAPAAPEVAADDDDGGDADPEPERRRTRKTSITPSTLAQLSRPKSARTYSTDEAAGRFHVQGQSLRAAVCRHGHYMGIRPHKLPNRLLAWPADEVERVANGGAA